MDGKTELVQADTDGAGNPVWIEVEVKEPAVTSIHLTDPDNRDADGGSYEFTGPPEQVIGYLNGAVRKDTLELAHGYIDAAIAALRAGSFEEAKKQAQLVGVYLTAAPERED